MGVWSYSPRYLLLLRQSGNVTWSLSTLHSAQCLLVTGQGVAQAQFALADPTGFIRRTVQPRPMNLVQLWLVGKDGFCGVAWTGYVDEVHRAFDPDSGSGVSLSCTSAVKLFEITRQSPADVANLAVAYAQNATGSAVLTYAAQACGYPSSMLRIHPVADSGSGYQQIGADVFTSPNQQSWSAVISAIQANSGTEWWFDERAHCYYRQMGFWDPWFSAGLPGDPARPTRIRPRTISDDEILQADLFDSDQGVVTDIELRYYGGGGLTQTAVHWPRSGAAGGPAETAAHKSMVAHLRTRRLVVYAPWITNSSAAQYLVDVLGAQYSAGVAQGSVTIPATPAVGIGSLVDVPALGSGGTSSSSSRTRFYVSSITYQLAWGSSWAMTLGLTYGRAPDQSFPYSGTLNWPTVSSDVRAGEAVPSPIASLDATNPAWDTTAYSIVAQAGLTKDQAATAAYPPGAVIQIYAQPRSKGALLGPAPKGEYTVMAPSNAAQSATSIALASTKQATGYVTIVSLAPPPALDVPTPALPQFAGAGLVAPDGTGMVDVSAPDPQAQGPAATAPLRALQMALECAGKPFDLNHAGPTSWDCSGLIAWSYAQVGIGVGQLFFPTPDNGKSFNTDGGPIGVWRYMQTIGGTPTSVANARKGDLLFCQGDDGSMSHVCFCFDPQKGTNYGANWYPHQIGVTPIAGFLSDAGAPINRALDLSALSVGGQRGQTVQEMVTSAADAAFGPGEGDALWQIVLAESSGSPSAVNPTSGACGLFQRLPCPWADVTKVDISTQITDGVAYVKTRYGSASKALAFRQAQGWY